MRGKKVDRLLPLVHQLCRSRAAACKRRKSRKGYSSLSQESGSTRLTFNDNENRRLQGSFRVRKIPNWSDSERIKRIKNRTLKL